MIIAADFDGTLFHDGDLNIPLIVRLKKEQRRGNKVILWTCRHGRSLHEAVACLQQSGFRPDYVNCNAPEAIKRLKADPRKIYADVYIDDKAVRA